jgi:hypothetical protein
MLQETLARHERRPDDLHRPTACSFELRCVSRLRQAASAEAWPKSAIGVPGLLLYYPKARLDGAEPKRCYRHNKRRFATKYGIVSTANPTIIELLTESRAPKKIRNFSSVCATLLSDR